MRIALALGLTALVLVQDIRGLRRGHRESGWFLGTTFLHGSLLIAVNVFFYAYICWVAFSFVRGTTGRERVFIVGWFAGILLWPIKMLLPHWATPVKHIGAFGLAVAFLAALALLLESNNIAETSEPKFIDRNVQKP